MEKNLKNIIFVRSLLEESSQEKIEKRIIFERRKSKNLNLGGNKNGNKIKS